MVNAEGVVECSYLFGKEVGRGTEENFPGGQHVLRDSGGRAHDAGSSR